MPLLCLCLRACGVMHAWAIRQGATRSTLSAGALPLCYTRLPRRRCSLGGSLRQLTDDVSKACVARSAGLLGSWAHVTQGISSIKRIKKIKNC